MIISLRASAVLLAVLFLPACVTSGALDGGPGSALAKRYKSSPALSGMNGRSIRKAVSAELKALETAAPGTVTKWTGGRGVSGQITPGQAFEISGRTCRLFDHRVTVDGEIKDLSATACRVEKNDWTPVN